MAVIRTHHPVWDREPCLACGTCTRHCPTTVFPEQAREPESLRGQVARRASFPSGARPAVPPCRAACPLGQDVPGYNRAISKGDFDGALQIILESNPLPGVCGRLCLRACMHACVRGAFEAPLEIRALKRAALEFAQGNREAAADLRGVKVAVVGAGPAGLSAATFLRRRGVAVTLLDAADHPGGLLRSAVPLFDLPSEVLDEEIARVLGSGIDFRSRWTLRSENDLEALFAEGARAVVLAIGAGRGRRLGIFGETLRGCHEVIAFARALRAPGGPALHGPVVVAGSGNMAAAAARMAVRAGGGPVFLVTRRRLPDCAADPDTLRRAQVEGVQVIPETQPIEILGKDEVRAISCLAVTFGPKDAVGRRWPTRTTSGAWMELPATTFVAASDREVDLDWRAPDSPIRQSAVGTLLVDDRTLMTTRTGVFAAGEAITGPRNVIEAIATGRKAAEAVARFLDGAKP